MSRFYPLTVKALSRETRDSVVLTLEPAESDREQFAFTQGQYLTLRHDFDGEEARRSYSICAGVDDGQLRVGVKKVTDGLFSAWVNEHLRPGMVIEAMPPMGTFHCTLEPSRARSYLGVAAGSGITPLLSIIKTTLVREPKSTFTLIYGNRSSNSIMFREELEDLKNTYLGRLSIVHVLSRENQDVDLFNGRIDAEKCAALFRLWVHPQDIDRAFICGPQDMMVTVAEQLKAHGMDEHRIKFELFAAAPRSGTRRKQQTERQPAADVHCQATIVLDGLSRRIDIPKGRKTILDAALEQGLEVPYACKGGVCSTCRAMVLEGEVEMDTNFALEDYEVRRGYVLTCQCYPLTDKVVVDYDQ